MEIVKKRINNVQKYLSDISENQPFFIGIKIEPIQTQKILSEKFNKADETGLVFIPKPYNGIMAQRNTVGEFLSDKSKPKETAYRAQSWSLKDWGGNIHSGTSEVPYPSYPKIFIEPFGLNFILLNDKHHLVINKQFNKNKSEYEKIKSAINLTLELFNKAETFILDVDTDMLRPVRQSVPWEILPQGVRIWNAFKDVDDSNQVSKSAKILIEERFKYLEKFKPDIEYQGTAGYSGYIAFAFSSKNVYVLDSILYGNATYIFDGNWEEVSQLTKKQIIDDNLYKYRIIHDKKWKTEIANILDFI
ncbi:hypothetical protein G9406_10260 [Weissella paramesenteroides]|uniref:hypothetical protein n=1 Tax=Lactobacillaceae TaxID=33958 RepID=UPI0023603E60|nr:MULTISPECIES: hypothetical protein [Lactobacillaceae]MDF8367949.1 hypothetical protein [Weissella paramesenteroides]